MLEPEVVRMVGREREPAVALAPEARILIVDVDAIARATLSHVLRRAGFTVELAADVGAARGGALRRFDMVIIDPSTSAASRFAFCGHARRDGIAAILIVTATARVTDRVAALDAGADDFIAKPYDEAELVSRARAILRRTRAVPRHPASITRLGDLEIDFARHRVRVGERRIALTLSESKLLALLARQPGRPYSRREILTHLWDTDHLGDERACDAHISHLRRKIEHDPAHPERIVTARGVGYVLQAA
jgi:DNA-binding response OmpR family regulator